MEENQDRLDFIKFRSKNGLQQPNMGYKQEALFDMLRKVLQTMPNVNQN